MSPGIVPVGTEVCVGVEGSSPCWVSSGKLSRLAVLSAAPRHTSCSGSSLGFLVEWDLVVLARSWSA